MRRKQLAFNLENKHMKLNRLSILNCQSITVAELELRKRVNIFFGKNEQGKTSVLDSPLWGLTGFCHHRGIRHKNKAQLMSKDGDGGMVVESTWNWNGTSEMVHRDQADFYGVLNPLLEDAQLMNVIFHPETLMTMKPAERLTLFQRYLQTDDSKKDYEKYIAGMAVSNSARTILLKGDLDKAQKWAVEQRRLNNKLAEQVDEDKKLATGKTIQEIDGKRVNLSTGHTVNEGYDPWTTDFEELPKSLANYNKTRRELEGRLEKVKDTEPIQKLMDELNKTPDYYDDAALEADTEKLKTLGKKRSKEGELNDRAAKYIDDLKAEIRRITGVYDQLQLAEQTGESEDECVCRTCQQPIAEEYIKNVMESVLSDKESEEMKLADMESKIAKSDKKYEDLCKEYSVASEASGKAQQSQFAKEKDIKRLETELAEAKESQERKVEWQKSLDEITPRIAAVEQIIFAKNTYDANQAKYEALDNKAKSYRDLAVEADAIDIALKADGDLRKIANQDTKKVEFDEGLKKVWGMESLSLETNGDIKYNGRMIEQGSESEQWRMTAMITELLSRKSELGIWCLDGIDVLDCDYLEGLQRVIQGMDITESHDTILINTSDTSGATGTPPAYGAWMVDDGRIYACEEEAVFDK